jgi:O-acetyl-ADP-ribose deacetylase (regulator of RNase III)
MIQFLKTNLFDQEVDALVNTVNTVGIMGKGIAFQFKERFPLNFKLYQAACKSGEIEIGKPLLTRTGEISSPKYIINFPTKKDWRENSKLEYIQKGLVRLMEQIKENNIQSIALPPLGCGNGGLDWRIVKPILEDAFQEVKNLDIRIIEPGHLAFASPRKRQDTPPLTKPRALILTLAQRYGVLGFDLSHLELQKLAYFVQEMGQTDLKLNFTKGTYGPYAVNLKHLLAYLSGHYIHGEMLFQDQSPTALLTLDRQLMEEVKYFADQNFEPEEKARIEKVTRLIEGFESPLGLELLATVHWAMRETQSSNLDTVHTYIENWNNRKRQLMAKSIVNIALERLKGSFLP